MNLAEWTAINIVRNHFEHKFLKEAFVYEETVGHIPRAADDRKNTHIFYFNLGPREYGVGWFQIGDRVRGEVFCHYNRFVPVHRIILDRKEIYASIVNRGMNE
jgi:hypothetical protein